MEGSIIQNQNQRDFKINKVQRPIDEIVDWYLGSVDKDERNSLVDRKYKQFNNKSKNQKKDNKIDRKDQIIDLEQAQEDVDQHYDIDGFSILNGEIISACHQ